MTIDCLSGYRNARLERKYAKNIQNFRSKLTFFLKLFHSYSLSWSFLKSTRLNTAPTIRGCGWLKTMSCDFPCLCIRMPSENKKYELSCSVKKGEFYSDYINKIQVLLASMLSVLLQDEGSFASQFLYVKLS